MLVSRKKAAKKQKTEENFPRGGYSNKRGRDDLIDDEDPLKIQSEVAVKLRILTKKFVLLL